MSKPIIRVMAAIIVDDQKILCARKAPEKPLAGFWEFPGGKLEVGESETECLTRELYEELHLHCRIGAKFAENRHEYADKIVELVAYWADVTNGELSLTDHDEVRWCAIEQLSELKWAPADVPFVQRLQQLNQIGG